MTPSISSINPATGETIGSVPITSSGELDSIFLQARAAQADWASTPVKDRAQILTKVRKKIVDRADDLISIIAREAGKTHWDGFIEVFTTVEHLRTATRSAPKVLRKTRRSTGLFKHKQGYVQYLPQGVVGIISPWNYPLILTASPVVEALLAGNAVVLKPSELTPLSGKLIREIFIDGGVPEAVLQIVFGYGDLGAKLVGSSQTDMICFTGSVEVGRKIAIQCGELLKPVVLELGGKDPLIVLEDANLERASGAAVWGGFANCGQTCISVERIYVVESVADEFLRLVHEKTSALKFGPDKELNDLGALANDKQRDLVIKQIEDARSSGASVSQGGKDRRDLGGFFISPAIIEVQDHKAEIMTRETFGPEITVMRVKDEEEAIRMANRTGYGLSASVFTKNKKRGKRIAGKIRAGSVCINDVNSNYSCAELPFGGIGISGIGRVHGPEGLQSFCQVQAVCVDRFGLNREPWWFPVSGKIKSIFRWFVRNWYG